MKKSLIAAIVLSVLGYASAGRGDPTPTLRVSADQDTGRFVISSSGKRRHVYKNATECAPDLGMAVWGPGPTAKPLGYRCYNNPSD